MKPINLILITLCLLGLLILSTGCRADLLVSGNPSISQISPSRQFTASPTLEALTQTPSRTPSPVPTSTPTPLPCFETQGQILDQELNSKLLKYPLSVKVYLPPCYGVDPAKKYPVLYMLHGQASLNDQWERLGLLSTADELITAKKIEPFIIVMPYEISWSIGPDVSKFGETVVKELFPYIEESYHTCTERACRAIGGLSRGGNWAVNLGFAYPEFFTAVGAHSTPLFYGEISRITTRVQAKKAPEEFPAIYIDVGNRDKNRQQVLDFMGTLKKLGVPYTFTEYKGYHEEKYWSAHVQDYLTWYDGQFKSHQ
jgi:enterochelin esterase-like enzyme